MICCTFLFKTAREALYNLSELIGWGFVLEAISRYDLQDGMKTAQLSSCSCMMQLL